MIAVGGGGRKKRWNKLETTTVDAVRLLITAAIALLSIPVADYLKECIDFMQFDMLQQQPGAAVEKWQLNLPQHLLWSTFSILFVKHFNNNILNVTSVKRFNGNGNCNFIQCIIF